MKSYYISLFLGIFSVIVSKSYYIGLFLGIFSVIVSLAITSKIHSTYITWIPDEVKKVKCVNNKIIILLEGTEEAYRVPDYYCKE
jgi:hypothetical protein